MTLCEDQKAVIARMEECLNTLHSANECLRSKNRSLIDKSEIQRVEIETLEMEKTHVQVEVQDLKITLEKSEALGRDSHNALTHEKEDHKQTKYRLVREEQMVESLQNKLHYEESCCRESNQDLARQMENVRRLESELRRRQTGTGDSEHFPFPGFPLGIRVSSDLTWEDYDAREECFAWDEEQESIEPSPTHYRKYDEQDLTEQPLHTYQFWDFEADAPRQSGRGRGNSQPLKIDYLPAPVSPLPGPSTYCQVASLNEQQRRGVVIVGHDMTMTPREIDVTGTGWETNRNRRGRRDLRNQGNRYLREYNGY